MPIAPTVGGQPPAAGGIPGRAWFDAYSLRAHWAPMLAVIAPPLVAITAMLPGTLPWRMTTAGILAAALPPALGLLSRNLGKQLEAELWEVWDGKPTTRFLRHRDNTLSERTKARYFEFLRAGGISRPTPAREAADPAAADATYDSTGDWLRRHVRVTGCNPHCERQNAAYGFARNMLGVRRLGLAATLAAGAVAVLLASRAAWAGSPGEAEGPLVAAAVLNLVMAAFWFRGVRPDWVRSAADAYAFAILETCEGSARAPAMTAPRGPRGGDAVVRDGPAATRSRRNRTEAAGE